MNDDDDYDHDFNNKRNRKSFVKCNLILSLSFSCHNYKMDTIVCFFV